VKFDVENGIAGASSVLARLPYPSGLLFDAGQQLLVTSLGNNNPNDPIYPTVFPGAVFKFNPADGMMVGGGPFMTGGAEFQPTSILVRRIAGDFDGDGALAASDIDQLSSAIREGSTLAQYDLNRNGSVNAADRTVWVNELKRTYFGDANLDGEMNSSDLVVVFEAGQYEDSLVGNSTWAVGDWDGNAEFDTGDLVTAFQAGGYEQGPRQAVASVPEPASGLAWCGAALLGLWWRGSGVFTSRSPRSEKKRLPSPLTSHGWTSHQCHPPSTVQ
jgi:hypothetical protein